MRNSMDYDKREANRILTGVLDIIDDHMRTPAGIIPNDREVILSIEECIRKKAV